MKNEAIKIKQVNHIIPKNNDLSKNDKQKIKEIIACLKKQQKEDNFWENYLSSHGFSYGKIYNFSVTYYDIDIAVISFIEERYDCFKKIFQEITIYRVYDDDWNLSIEIKQWKEPLVKTYTEI